MWKNLLTIKFVKSVKLLAKAWPSTPCPAAWIPSVVTALGHKALGNRLKTYIIDNGIMREDEPAKVAAAFKKLGIKVEVVDCVQGFFCRP